VEQELRDVDSVVDKNVLVVLGQCDYVAFRRHTQTTASAHLHVRTFQLRGHCAVALQNDDVETVAMAVADENVTRVARVNPIWICCQRLVAKPMDEFPVLRKHGDAMTLKHTPDLTNKAQ